MGRTLGCLLAGAVLALVSPPLGTGCSSTRADPADAGVAEAGGTPFTPEELRSASLAFTTKLCAGMEKCDPVYLAAVHGTLANCQAPEQFLAEGVGPFVYGAVLTPATLRACADALDFSRCDAWVFLNYEGEPAACRELRYGTLPEGSICGDWNQCSSGRCYGSSAPDFCGRCVAQQPAGAGCSYQYACENGSICIGDKPETATCTRFGEIGAPCGRLAPCRNHLLCAAGTCVEAPQDGACDGGTGCPASPRFHWCNPATSKCEPIPLAAIGQPCGERQPPPGILCAYGGTCTRVVDTIADAGGDAATDPDAGPAPDRFICMPRIELGGACVRSDHPYDEPCKAGTCFREKCQPYFGSQCTPPPVAP